MVIIAERRFSAGVGFDKLSLWIVARKRLFALVVVLPPLATLINMGGSVRTLLFLPRSGLRM